jgi:hypothetical protein
MDVKWMDVSMAAAIPSAAEQTRRLSTAGLPCCLILSMDIPASALRPQYQRTKEFANNTFRPDTSGPWLICRFSVSANGATW